MNQEIIPNSSVETKTSVSWGWGEEGKMKVIKCMWEGRPGGGNGKRWK